MFRADAGQVYLPIHRPTDGVRKIGPADCRLPLRSR